METHILIYDYVDDLLERRAPFREAHLEAIRSARERGQLTLAGAVGDPPHGGMLVFQGVSPEEIDAYARRDPYMEAGLIQDYRIERWNLV
ncbi:MAG TPA: YciI family protein [Solirubrobacteraceae bacterium]|nr:YciI family protein [Solirubrobacteraceae bacterium]